ncbi:RcnB family protein [Phenylobacterium sp.]|uniref:RcnB family protein n=1 Tax=Phenylobacterium sp. TaxID=1871053 RepID=UPI0027346AB2|nr:RcnB family protein [Phenylobacterium sp.]MDP3660257.1 RcnB family protein [Phenylobacterium sp.]
MKRLIMSLTLAAVVAGPLALSAGDASAQPRYERGDDRWDRRDDRRDDRRSDRGNRRWDRGDGRNDGRWDRDDRRSDRGWDRGRHNGYYFNNTWHYGPPPQTYYTSPYYRPGYNAWRRGAYLPPSYRGYMLNDYGRYHLRAPPRGYAWYRVDDDYLLAAIASGLIFDIIGDR